MSANPYRYPICSRDPWFQKSGRLSVLGLPEKDQLRPCGVTLRDIRQNGHLKRQNHTRFPPSTETNEKCSTLASLPAFSPKDQRTKTFVFLGLLFQLLQVRAERGNPQNRVAIVQALKPEYDPRVEPIHLRHGELNRRG